jgi:hypothetical protein
MGSLVMLSSQVAHNLSDLSGTRLPKRTPWTGIGHSVRFFSGEGNDWVQFAGLHKVSERKKCFWATVNRAAFGGKYANGWRKALGVLTYPYHCLKHAFLWLLGQKEGFKTLHPLARESRDQVLARIEALNKRIQDPSLRFNFSREDVEKAGLHKNHLLKMYDAQLGAHALLTAKDWNDTAEALEHFLSANGKNNGESCANISFTHSQKLVSGAPIKCRKIPKALVSFNKDSNQMFLRSPELEAANVLNYKALLDRGEKKLLESFKIQGQIQEVSDIAAIEKALLKPGSQAFLFDLKGETSGHLTLVVNIKGRLYHIDNLSSKSAHVSDLNSWLTHKQPDRLWYGLSKDEVHPAIANP